MVGAAWISPAEAARARDRHGREASASGTTHLPWIVEARPDTFEQELKASVPVLVDLWAPWCGPCRAVSPLVERMGQENAGHLKVLELNVDQAPRISDRYGVRGVPLLVLTRDAIEAHRLVGAVPAARPREWLKPHLEPSASQAA